MVYKIPEFDHLTEDDRIIAYRRLGRLLRASLELQGPNANHRFIGLPNNQAIRLLQNVWASKMTAPSLGKYVKGVVTGDLKPDTFQQLGSLCFKPTAWKVSDSDPVGRPVFSAAIKQYDEEKMITAIYSTSFNKLPDSRYRMTYEDVLNFMLHPPIVQVAGDYQDQFGGKQLFLV